MFLKTEDTNELLLFTSKMATLYFIIPGLTNNIRTRIWAGDYLKSNVK